MVASASLSEHDLDRRARLWLGLLLGLVVVAYLPAVDTGMGGDDLNWFHGAVRGLERPLTLLDVQHNFYRPVEQLYFFVVLLLSGSWYPGWLAAAVAVHLANTLLVARVAHELSGDRLAAGLAAGWWALHHLHVETLVRPYGIADPLLMLFGLSTLVLLLRNRPILALVCFLLALGSKEGAIVLPVLLAAWAFLLPPSRRRVWWLRVTPIAVLAAASAVLVMTGVTARPSYLEPDPAAALSAAWENVASWIGPDLHYIRYVELGSAEPLIPLWLAAVLTVAALVSLLRADWPVRLAAGWIAVMMAPTLLVPLQPARYQYVPMVGMALLLALAASRLRLGWAARPSRRLVALALLAAVVGWQVAGIQLESTDFGLFGQLHRRAATSFRAQALPAMAARPGSVTVFLRPDDRPWIEELRRQWDRHPWWAPTSHKLLFRRVDGILGLSNTRAFVTWAAYGLAPDPLFVSAPTPLVREAALEGRLVVVHHRGQDNTFYPVAVKGVRPWIARIGEPEVWRALQPGRFSADGTGELYR